MKFKILVVFAAALLLRIEANAITESALYTFTGGSDGANPVNIGRMFLDDAGTLYGTTEYGGSCGEGTVFQLSADGVETVLHNFCGTDGAHPIAGLRNISAGVFYGTTLGGGTVGCGTVFKLTGSTLTTLYSFSCGSDGGSPIGLIVDASGNVYGIANLGGISNNGLVYEISASGQYSVIYTFCPANGCADGSSPAGELQLDAEGNLYGTTVNGGGETCSLGCGTIFKLSNVGGSWSETVLHSFTGADGQYPNSLTLVSGSTQRILFIGTANEGGSGGGGTVFSLSQSDGGFKLRTLHEFSGSEGEYPQGGLSEANGKIFGSTSYSGSGGYGTIFELTKTKGDWTALTLYSFTDGSDGGDPESGVVFDKEGNLYGTTVNGGNDACDFGCGVVFKIAP